MFWLTFGLALAGTPNQDIEEAWSTYQQHATFQVLGPDEKQRDQLLAGNVVKIVQHRQGAPSTALALLVMDYSIEEMWLAEFDPHFNQGEDFVLLELTAGRPHTERWYGYLDLPFPFSDRQWVADTWFNEALAKATANRQWEFAWTLTPQGLALARPAIAANKLPGVTLERMDAAIMTPDNEGAWLFLRLPEGRSLLGYHVTSTVGGSVPDWLVLRLVMGRLDELLRDVESRCATGLRGHYDSKHVRIMGGDHQPVDVGAFKR
ncbi:MAG: hypothetical protein ACI9MC_001794 [Kiritimatiellia bacterium]|jgi:hypothetical protein